MARALRTFKSATVPFPFPFSVYTMWAEREDFGCTLGMELEKARGGAGRRHLPALRHIDPNHEGKGGMDGFEAVR